MHRPTFFKKLLPKLFILYVFGFLGLVGLGRYHFKDYYYHETTEHLLYAAELLQDPIQEFLLENDVKGLIAHIKKSSKKIKQRITVVLPSGKVLVDSERNAEEMDIHSDRPEILKAFSGEVGQSIRFSNTMKEEFIYVAIPLKVNGQVIGVLRNSYQTGKITPALNNFTWKLFTGSVALGILLIFLLSIVSRNVNSSLNRIQTKAQSYAEGKFDVLIPSDPDDSYEINSLVKSLNEMALKLGHLFNKTERQRNEREAILEGMSEGVLSVYMDNHIFHWNRAVCRFFDVPYTDHYKGLPLVEIFRNKQIHDMVDFIKSSNGVIEEEITLANNKILQVHGNILKKNDGTDLCVLMVFTDITKIRLLENHRKEFVANVSHELRTPLTSISGYVDTLLEGEVNSEEMQKKFLSTVKRNSDRLHRIIEDLLALSELDLENENNEIKLDKITISNLLEGAVSHIEEKATKKNTEITIEVPEDRPLQVNIRLIEQAISNLIDNAVKYSGENAKVQVKSSIDHQNQWVTIKIIDNGPGIPKDHQERLFERFYSVNKARSRELGGSGLGLSIVKNIILAHRGNVSVESEVGKGSVFSITLPMDLSTTSLTIS